MCILASKRNASQLGMIHDEQTREEIQGLPMIAKLHAGDHHKFCSSMARCHEFTNHHNNIVELYCKVEPDHITLTNIFDSVHLSSGGLAFSSPQVRRSASNRNQTIKRRRGPVPVPQIFAGSDFYPFFEQNQYIDTLLLQQLSETETTMSTRSRTKRRNARDDETANDDLVMEDDDILSAAAGLHNLNLNTRSR
jgi:hypothetical protein